MRPSQAAVIIGCAKSHVTLLIRQGKLTARRVPTENNQLGYRYEITEQAVKQFCERWDTTPVTRGWPMGQPRKPKER